MAKSIVLFGPQGSGKGIYAEFICAKHGLKSFMDLEDVQFAGERLRREGVLYLTSSRSYGQRAAGLLGTPMLELGEALADLGVVIQHKEVGHG